MYMNPTIPIVTPVLQPLVETFVKENVIAKDAVWLILKIIIVTAVSVIIGLLVFSVNIVSIVALNQNVKIMSDQIIDYATQNGTTDIGDYVNTLRENSGIDFACSFAGTDYLSGQKVQLGDVIRCKLTYRVSIFGFGDAVFPVTVQADSQGISQVYWK